MLTPGQTAAQPNPPQTGIAPPLGPQPQQLNVGGIMSMKPLSTIMAEEATAAAKEQAQQAQNEPMIQGLAGHVRAHWRLAEEAKQPVEQDMLEAVRAKRGEYTPEKLAEIERQGGSAIFMMLFATKARQAKALLTDVMIGTGSEKPWTIGPTPSPELPPQEVTAIQQGVEQMVFQAEMSGLPMSIQDIRAVLQDAKEQLENQIQETARIYAERAEKKLEDCLVEGGFLEALDGFLDDLTTFKSAVLKGPIIRNVPQLEWGQGQDGAFVPNVVTKKMLQWERVSPFDIYPAPWSKTVNDAFLIERHRLSRGDLTAMIGVEGYSESAIRSVLDEHGTGGLHDWLSIDAERASAEGRDSLSGTGKTSDLIDALQYWGSVSGKMLREWGMKDIPDDSKEYEVECWLVGQWVIKAVLNPDPLARRPYYSTGYSKVPGAFWHCSLYDLIKDCQDMCNGAARALANNLGIASGPQVVVNTERLATGEDITQMFPWKIWQTVNDPSGNPNSQKPVDFFSPTSNAQELMAVYEKFSMMADEYSGIPRYMAGVEGGSVSRTASGLNMMMGNANKTIKQLVASIDLSVLTPLLERLYQWKLRYEPDPDMAGDLRIVARGALSLQAKESAQVRRNEFLQITANPFDMQILGLEGRAEVLRATAKTLELNPDKIVPSQIVLKQRAMAMAMAQQGMQPGGEQDPNAEGGDPQQQQQQPGGSQQQSQKKPSQERLMNGAPTTDHFSPSSRK
jgi:hypothetical protein